MPACQNCGGHVSTRFRRVFGDNDDEVYGCHGCMGVEDIRDGEPARPEP